MPLRNSQARVNGHAGSLLGRLWGDGRCRRRRGDENRKVKVIRGGGLRILFLKTVRFGEVLGSWSAGSEQSCPENAVTHRITEEDVSVCCSDSSERLVLHSCSKAFIKGLSLHVLYSCKSGLSLNIPGALLQSLHSVLFLYPELRFCVPLHSSRHLPTHTLHIVLFRIVAHPTPPAFKVP